jgi:hypothetical protein
MIKEVSFYLKKGKILPLRREAIEGLISLEREGFYFMNPAEVLLLKRYRRCESHRRTVTQFDLESF